MLAHLIVCCPGDDAVLFEQLYNFEHGLTDRPVDGLEGQLWLVRRLVGLGRNSIPLTILKFVMKIFMIRNSTSGRT